MCLILDANCYHAFLNPEDENMQQVMLWLDKKGGKLVYSEFGDLQGEMKNYPKMYAWFLERRRTMFRLVDAEKMKKEFQRVQNEEDLKSDDPHVIALANVANVKLLVSNDEELHTDFKVICKGKVYQYKQQAKRLLRPDTCP